MTSGLVWTSSIDGQIGTGGSFSATLSDDTHTVTAVVADSDGDTGSASITVMVGGDDTGGGDLVLSGSSVNNGSSWTATATLTGPEKFIDLRQMGLRQRRRHLHDHDW